MTHEERVTELVTGLRKLAEFYEAHPEMPLPCLDIVNAFVDSKNELAKAAREMGNCKKEFLDDWFALTKEFSSVIRLDVCIRRKQVCERIVTGKRLVPEAVTPAHEEEIIKWRCNGVAVLKSANGK